jgi:hypothetical protein
MLRRAVPVLLLVLVTTAASAMKPKTTNGEAVVRNIGGNRVAVLLDTNDDKKVDQGFLLSSDLPVTATSMSCPAAMVEFTDSYVRVTYDRKTIDLYVAGYPEPPAVPEEHETRKFIGYALVHSSGNSGCSLERALSDAGSCYNYGKD